MKGKKALKIIGIIVAVIAVLIAVSIGVTAIGNKANTEKAKSFEKVQIENQLIPVKGNDGNWIFTADRDFRVMQLTDIHIGAGWMSQKKDAMALNAVAAMVTAEKPDLVVVTGDIAYPVPFQSGTFNNLAGAKIFAALMEQLGVYWTVAFGNHDTEAYSYYNRAEISDFYENSGFEYCLYHRGPENIDGYGNNIIKVQNSNGEITQAIFTFDSHSYTDGDYLGIFWKYDNIHENQVEWYKQAVLEMNAHNAKLTGNESATVKSSAFFHIPLTEQRDAWYEYVENGFEDTENVKFVYGKAGEDGKIVYPGMNEDSLFETMLELGSTKAVFCGHDHENNFSVEYKGIRLSYAMSVDYLAYPGIYKLGTQRGCTMITYSPDGSFDCKNENYYQDKYTSLYNKEAVTMQELTNLAELPE